jgi:hypothetical protein
MTARAGPPAKIACREVKPPATQVVLTCSAEPDVSRKVAKKLPANFANERELILRLHTRPQKTQIKDTEKQTRHSSLITFHFPLSKYNILTVLDESLSVPTGR